MSETHKDELLEYRVNQIEKTQETQVELVNGLVTKVALLAQKLAIWGVIITLVTNIAITGAKDILNYSEKDKMAYYETRIKDSKKIQELENDLKNLKIIVNRLEKGK